MEDSEPKNNNETASALTGHKSSQDQSVSAVEEVAILRNKLEESQTMVATLSSKLQKLQLKEETQRLRIAQLEQQMIQLNGSKTFLRSSLESRISLAALSATEKSLDENNELQTAALNAPRLVGRVKEHVQRYEEMAKSVEKPLVAENELLAKPATAQVPIPFNGLTTNDSNVNNSSMESEQISTVNETEKESLPAIVHQVFTSEQQRTILEIYVTERKYISLLNNMKVFDFIKC